MVVLVPCLKMIRDLYEHCNVHDDGCSCISHKYVFCHSSSISSSSFTPLCNDYRGATTGTTVARETS